MTARVLVAGVPRSGTTWVGRVLGHTEAAQYVHEPDNHLVRPEAWWAKRGLGPYPALAPGQAAPEYERLWELAFAGGSRPSLLYTSARLVHRTVPRAGRRALAGKAGGAVVGTLRLAGRLAARGPAGEPSGNVVVKSVFCARSLEWIAARFAPAVVVVERHPFAIIASWSALGWTAFLDRDPAAVRYGVEALGVNPPLRDGPWIDRAAWHCGFLVSLLQRAVVRHPEWRVVRHEALCADPRPRFQHLCHSLGLGWTEAAEAFLAASNRPGRGYSTNRLWAEEVDSWRSRLSPADQARVVEVLEGFHLGDFEVADPPVGSFPVPAAELVCAAG